MQMKLSWKKDQLIALINVSICRVRSFDISTSIVSKMDQTRKLIVVAHANKIDRHSNVRNTPVRVG